MSVTGAGISSATPRPAVSSAPITVLVDSARLAMVKAWEAAHPSIKLAVTTGDAGANGSGSLEEKVALANRVGHGWPDIMFSAEQNDVQKLGFSPFNYPAVLNNGLVPSSVLNNYAAGALAPCMVGKQLECLRNDMAFDVLWVNVPLMKQLGYTVPTTWQQWQAIGLDVAKNHPGYIIGELGDSYDDAIYLQAAQCHLNDVLASYSLLSNPNDPTCVNMANLLNPLLKDGTVPAVNGNVFGSTFGKTWGGKVLMTVGPAWYSTAIFEGKGSVLDAPAGTYAAYPPLIWAGTKHAWTGDVGGGLWILSSHLSGTQLQAAANVLVGLATSNVSQLQSEGYPGYVPAAKVWIAAQDKSGLFATPLAPAFATAAPEVWPGWSQTPWDVFGLWAQNVTPNLTAGDTVSSQLSVMASAILNNAQSDGYQVKS
jgi:multiple sugar transport system substrate-binding protein